jgi:hypothetical protein
VLLKHLQNKTITKEQFIEKLNAKASKDELQVEHASISDNDIVAVPEGFDEYTVETNLVYPHEAALVKATKNSVLSSQSADSPNQV